MIVLQLCPGQTRPWLLPHFLTNNTKLNVARFLTHYDQLGKVSQPALLTSRNNKIVTRPVVFLNQFRFIENNFAFFYFENIFNQRQRRIHFDSK